MTAPTVEYHVYMGCMLNQLYRYLVGNTYVLQNYYKCNAYDILILSINKISEEYEEKYHILQF